MGGKTHLEDSLGALALLRSILEKSGPTPREALVAPAEVDLGHFALILA